MLDNKLDIYYLRLSMEDGDVEDGNAEESCSIKSQRFCIQKYLQDNSFRAESFMEIADDGYSGTTMNRPGMKKLLKLVEESKVRTIIVRDLSRFARNYLEAGHYLEFVFPAYDVRFISINDQFDSEEMGETTGGLELAIRNLINQMYSKDISRKIKSAVDMKKLNGEYVYGTAPYGYKKGEKKNTIVIDDEVAFIVKEIFQWAAEGVSITQIACRMNQAAIATPSMHLAEVRGKYKIAKHWGYESVRNILINRIYTGDTVPFKSHVVRIGSDRVKMLPVEEQQIIPNTHEAIISRELFYQAQTTIKSVKKSKGKKSNSPFTSLLICGCCGNRLAKGKQQNKNWMCSMHRYNPNTDCKAVRIEEARLSDIVLKSIRTQCQLLDAKINKIKQESFSAKTSDQVLRNECRMVKRKIENIQAKKMRLYEQYAQSELSKESYVAHKNELTTEEEHLKAQYIMLEQKQALFVEKMKMSMTQLTEGEKITPYQELDQLTPELTKELIKRIIIKPGGNIQIEWNFADELSELVDMTQYVSEKQAI